MDIKGVIKERGYSVNDVADMMGRNRVTLFQTISRNPTVETLQKIADAIGCKVADFFKDEILGGVDFIAMIRSNGETYTATNPDELAEFLNTLGYKCEKIENGED